MGRLFDVGQEEKRAAEASDRRTEARRRAEEFDAAMREAGLLDDTADKLGQELAVAKNGMSVSTIHYSTYRMPGAKWTIEHGRDGSDYIFQVFPLKPSPVAWGDIMSQMIAVMDGIFPRTVEIIYTPPNPTYQVQFYTIRVKAVTEVPGWETACRERALAGLSTIDAWPAPAPR